MSTESQIVGRGLGVFEHEGEDKKPFWSMSVALPNNVIVGVNTDDEETAGKMIDLLDAAEKAGKFQTFVITGYSVVILREKVNGVSTPRYSDNGSLLGRLIPIDGEKQGVIKGDLVERRAKATFKL